MAGRAQQTADGRYIVVNGRRWRATDPRIPEPLRTELVAELMDARRAVAGDAAAARPRVHDAKISLGERGEPWWEPTDAGMRARAAAAARTLLEHRAAERTICPSDVARIVGGGSWRTTMRLVREVLTLLHDDAVVEIRQGGRAVDPRSAKGPLRIGRGSRWSQRRDA